MKMGELRYSQFYLKHCQHFLQNLKIILRGKYPYQPFKVMGILFLYVQYRNKHIENNRGVCISFPLCGRAGKNFYLRKENIKVIFES